MPRLGLIVATALVFALVAAPKAARAEPMDPALERLTLNVTDPSTGLSGPCAKNGVYRGNASITCLPDNTAWRRLINQYGFALAPTSMHSARTTGFGGFQLSLEASFTSIDSDADYWKNGTQGTQDPNTKQFSNVNKSPDPVLQLYMLKIRKGFPLGFELTANVGYMAHTSIVSGGADISWSLLEGFRKGIPGIFPDLSVGTGVRTITGISALQLTVFSVDGKISKPLPIADSSVLTPFIGFQWIKIFGDSGLVDATPNTDPLGYCNYSGINVPGNPDPNKKVYDGQPICNGGSSLDSNNSFVFDRTRINRYRLMAGVNYRYEMVFASAQYITDLVDPSDANSGAEADALKGTPRQWTLAFDVGALF